MHLLKRSALLVAVALIASACLKHHASSEAVTGAPATLHVENNNWQEVDIRVVHRGITVHLGNVTAASTANFVFPQSVMGDLGEIQLIAHAIGTPETIRTNTIVLRAGTRVRWTLETSLYRSSLSVY